jgi:hypothetical protein
MAGEQPKTQATPERPDCVAGLRGLELANVILKRKSLWYEIVLGNKEFGPACRKIDISEFESSHPSQGVRFFACVARVTRCTCWQLLTCMLADGVTVGECDTFLWCRVKWRPMTICPPERGRARRVGLVASSPRGRATGSREDALQQPGMDKGP